MRAARLVGLSPDGRSLIVATDSGEQLSILADDRLRAALRGDRPRLGQLEIEMESALRPRDIQSRIRAGDSLEDVARVAGIPIDRVERYAAPVLAEREHIASLAMAATVRRRGETSGHKKLRAALIEKLQVRSIDFDVIEWDSARMDDGRWSVTATYPAGKATRKAVFYFDVSGRFSVAGNDEARKMIGEVTAQQAPGKPAAGDPDRADLEPTVDLTDELAIVRAVQHGAEEVDAGEVDDEEPPEPGTKHRPEEAASTEELHAMQPEDSELSNLYEMLGGAGYGQESEEPPTEYRGLSDASAVPETGGQGGWEPEIVVNYPIEPSLLDELPLDEWPIDGLPLDEDAKAEADDDKDAEPAEPQPLIAVPEPVAAEPATDEAEAEKPAPKKSSKRKRAAVPSWDEIMFGGPKKP